MRNVVLTRDEIREYPVNLVQQYCLNSETQEDYLLSSDYKVLHFGGTRLEVDLQQQIPDLEGKACGFSYELELDALCLAYESGQIFLVDPKDGLVDEVGCIEGGVSASSWSPEGELLAIISSQGLLLLFNKAFDVISETSVLAWPGSVVPSRKLPAKEEADLLSSATISWRGDGKYFATITHTLPSLHGTLRIWQRDGCVLHAIGEGVQGLLGPVSWQPNGRHIYAAQELDGEQNVILFERNGLSHGSFSIRGPGRTTALAWSADSSMVAIQQKTSRIEEGGLIISIWMRSNWQWYLKQELLFPHVPWAHMQWSAEGPNYLVICTFQGKLRKVELSLQHVASSLGTAAVVNGQELLLTPLRHSMVPPPLCAVTARFQAPIQCVAYLNQMQAEVIAVALSGGELAITKSNKADYWEETIEDAPIGSGQSAFAVDSLPGEFADGDGNRLDGTRIAIDGSPPLNCHIRALAWAGPERLVAVAFSDGKDVMLEVDISNLDAVPVLATFAGTKSLPGSVLSLASGVANSVLIQLQSGNVYSYNPSGVLQAVEGFPQPCPWMAASPQVGETAPGLKAFAVGLAADGHLYLGSKLVAASVTSVCVRHAAGNDPDYLLYTTKDNFLHTLPFLEICSMTGSQPSDKARQDSGAVQRRGLGEGRRGNHYTDMHTAMRGHGTAIPSSNILKARAIEQGSRIVAAPPDDIYVVLQLPRGNLETIYPRSLVLPAVASAVQEGDFAKAWQLATAHRVDLNLLVDYGWPKFLLQAESFIDQVSDDQDIVDLLSALREKSVVEEGGLYSGLPPANPTAHLEQVVLAGEKVAQINKALQRAMRARSPKIYLNPLVTSHATQGQLEDALSLIKEAKEAQLKRESSNSQASASGREQEDKLSMGQGALGEYRRTQTRQLPTAEDALKHLLLTVDVERLYRAALGMYELELAYMVVAHSQRDPGEYLLELQQFAAKPKGALREYAINMHLQRTPEAMRNLLAAGDDHFQEAVSLARKEGKLRELLSLVGDGPEDLEKRKQVLEQYGLWLSARHKLEDAAVAFLAAGNLEAAFREYEEANQWRMAMAIAGRLGFSKDRITDLAEAFVSSLSASSRLAEAATLASEYLHDADSAVSLLSQAREWREALRIAALFGRQDLIETTIAPQAAESASTLMEELQDTRDRITKYGERLKEVRDRRVAFAAALDTSSYGQQVAEEFDDTASEGGSSIVSGLSMYTQASEGRASNASSSGVAASTIGGRQPQGKQKKNRKGPRIRQGSPQEEEALVNYILSLAPPPQMCTEIGQLIEILVFFGHETDGRKLQALLSEVLAQQKAAAHRAITNIAQDLKNSIAKAPAEAEAVDWKWDILRPV